MQKLLRKPSVAPGIVALSFFPHGFALAVTRYPDTNRPRLLHCEFVPVAEQQRQSKLQALIRDHQLEDYDCHILLSPDQYRSISLEAPVVPAEELRQAIKWRIADMLEYPADQAGIDYYPLPKSNRANAPAMLEAVACRAEMSESLILLCKEAGLNVKVIDIQETALRNLASLLPENPQGVAVLHLHQNSGIIIIQKNGSIYLSRKFDYGYSRLTEGLLVDNREQLQLEQNNLALEIQRSLDYAEHFYDMPPINSLAVVLMPNDSYGIINFLNINYGITTRAMDLSAIIEGDILLNDTTQNLCAPCIGASLRRYLELPK
nr:pilus assembly protein PilM [Methylomonas sp. SURF-2]